MCPAQRSKKSLTCQGFEAKEPSNAVLLGFWTSAQLTKLVHDRDKRRKEKQVIPEREQKKQADDVRVRSPMTAQHLTLRK